MKNDETEAAYKGSNGITKPFCCCSTCEELLLVVSNRVNVFLNMRKRLSHVCFTFILDWGSRGHEAN